jgi:epoxyqueuosine reductase
VSKFLKDIPAQHLNKLIKQICLNAGFTKVGISRANELTEEKEFLYKWLNEKRNADMEWLSKNVEKRCNLKLIQESIISVISLAYLYDTPNSHTEDKSIPKISRYAWGKRDYHKVIKKKLKSVCKEIKKISPEIETRFYIDDGPVMEKVWAVKSGIGWMGKHTNIINPDIGSFFFLSEILINCKLEYDKPMEDLCESCNICVNACPTGAIYNDYKLDSNLCISYQTIENRGEIPESLNLYSWIFGCDICQDVCPFNQGRIFTNDKNFFPLHNVVNKTFDELLEISEEEFNKIFEGSSIKRTKYKGWLRNLKKAKQEIN